MIGEFYMFDKKNFRTDGTTHYNKIGKAFGQIIADRSARFSVEPSSEKDYDIYLMTGNNDEKGSEKK